MLLSKSLVECSAIHLYEYTIHHTLLMFNVSKIFRCLASRAGARCLVPGVEQWSIHHLAAALHGLYGLYDG